MYIYICTGSKQHWEVTERLRRASSAAPSPEDPLELLYRRRGARRRRERVMAGVVAMALFVALAGGSLYALQEMRSGRGAAVAGSGGASPGSSEDTSGPGYTLRSPVLAPGEYFYLRTEIIANPLEQNGQVIAEGGKGIVTTWWATDGSGRIESVAYEGDGVGVPEPGTFGAGEFPVESDVSALSTDPAVLYDQLLARSAPTGASPQPDVTPGGPGQTEETGKLWRAVIRLLEYPNVTPELRAALVRVAQEIPGVELLDNAGRMGGAGSDVGRPAHVVRLSIEDSTQMLAYDPGTMQPFEFELRPDGQWGTSEIWYEAIVPRPGDFPSDDQWVSPPGAA